jgi:hypothetical protein
MQGWKSNVVDQIRGWEHFRGLLGSRMTSLSREPSASSGSHQGTHWHCPHHVFSFKAPAQVHMGHQHPWYVWS